MINSQKFLEIILGAKGLKKLLITIFNREKKLAEMELNQMFKAFN